MVGLGHDLTRFGSSPCSCRSLPRITIGVWLRLGGFAEIVGGRAGGRGVAVGIEDDQIRSQGVRSAGGPARGRRLRSWWRREARGACAALRAIRARHRQSARGGRVSRERSPCDSKRDFVPFAFVHRDGGLRRGRRVSASAVGVKSDCDQSIGACHGSRRCSRDCRLLAACMASRSLRCN